VAGDAVPLPPECGCDHEERSAEPELDQVADVLAGVRHVVPDRLARSEREHDPERQVRQSEAGEEPGDAPHAVGAGSEVERRHDRGGVGGVEQPDPDHDREGVLHRASLEKFLQDSGDQGAHRAGGVFIRRLR